MMDGPESAGDDKSFTVNFSGEGAGRLKDTVKEKLKEFMGDYTDDTLVEYVIVLLRNGRRKDEARRELNVFLGDDSVAFVSWLWDHLSLSLHLYVQQESSLGKVDSEKPTEEVYRSHSSQPDPLSSIKQTDMECEREKPSRLSRTRRSREWKSSVQKTELFPLRSTVTEILRSEVRTHDRSNMGKRSRSPIPEVNKKRRRQDEGQPAKRDVSYPVIGASRRLLQFAVRDAVRTVQQSGSRTESSLKRLCSVISKSTPDSVLDERPQRARSVARVPGLSTALKAAVEAAEDVTKVRYPGGVFNRLGHGLERTESVNQSSYTRVPVLEEGEYEDLDQVPGSIDGDYHSRYDGDSTGDVTMEDRHDGVVSVSASDNDEYDNAGSPRPQSSDVSRSVSPAKEERPMPSLKSSAAQNADEIVRKTRLIDQDPPANAATNASSKIVNISVNVNTWKPPDYQASRGITQAESRSGVEKNEASAGKQSIRAKKEKDKTLSTGENVISRTVVQKETQKTVASTSVSYTTTRPSDDPDSRTVFVSNVHFAATKDALSRHFNKFGEVLKVVIMTDATTGQPTGSAYVEFLRKESAELALSLNGASFMSRILKVVRRSSSHHENASMMGWSRMGRSSAFASRMGRIQLPRGALTGSFRGRLPVKSGARSLQWKRGASTIQTSDPTKGLQNTSGGNIASPTGKNLTYVRTETKTDGNSGPA